LLKRSLAATLNPIEQGGIMKIRQSVQEDWSVFNGVAKPVAMPMDNRKGG